MVEKLKLDLSLILPDVPDERDACVSRARELAQAAGAKIGNRYRHEILRIGGMGHRDRACPATHGRHAGSLHELRSRTFEPGIRQREN